MPAVVGQRYPNPDSAGAGGGGSVSPGPEGSLLATIAGAVEWVHIVTDGVDVVVDGSGNVVLVLA